MNIKEYTSKGEAIAVSDRIIFDEDGAMETYHSKCISSSIKHRSFGISNDTYMGDVNNLSGATVNMRYRRRSTSYLYPKITGGARTIRRQTRSRRLFHSYMDFSHAQGTL